MIHYTCDHCGCDMPKVEVVTLDSYGIGVPTHSFDLCQACARMRSGNSSRQARKQARQRGNPAFWTQSRTKARQQ